MLPAFPFAPEIAITQSRTLYEVERAGCHRSQRKALAAIFCVRRTKGAVKHVGDLNC